MNPHGMTMGIVGGANPQAGLDLSGKIMTHTLTGRDQDHVPLFIISPPPDLPDPAAFLTGRSTVNPGIALGAAVAQLAGLGARVVGIPCPWAHAPDIFDAIRESLSALDGEVTLPHMIEETALFLGRHAPDANAAVLGATGADDGHAYIEALKRQEIRVCPLDRVTQDDIHDVIHNPDYGVRAYAHPVTPVARGILIRVTEALKKQGVDTVLLGCPELPLAVTEKTLGGVTVVDPTLLLARAMIREAAPEKLRPWP